MVAAIAFAQWRTAVSAETPGAEAAPQRPLWRLAAETMGARRPRA